MSNKFKQADMRPRDELSYLKEDLISSCKHFMGKVFQVEIQTVKLSDGSQAQREIIRHPGGACVVALNQDGQVALVRQFRAAFNRIMTEIPAGKLEPGEDPLVCAKRELREECGIEAGSWRKLAESYPSPGYDSEIIYIYLARNFDLICPPKLDQGEFLTWSFRPIEEVLELIARGEINDAKTQIGILRAWQVLQAEVQAE